MRITKIVIGLVFILLSINIISAEDVWQSDSDSINGLPDIGWYSTPTVFQKDSIWYLISGGNADTWWGYNWTGSTWQSDSDIISGLAGTTGRFTPTVFYKDSTWYLINGEQYGNWNGSNWTGSTWQSDSNIISGLPDIGSYSAPTVFQKDSIWYLIGGNQDGLWSGYNWTGSTWQSDSNIVSGLPDVGLEAKSSVFQRGNIWQLISGNKSGNWNGFNWTGSTWQSDSNIISGLTEDVGDYASLSIFQKNVKWDLISGNLIGQWEGFSTNPIWLRFNSSIPIINIINTDGYVYNTTESKTNWSTAGLYDNVTVVVSNYDNGTGNFQITNGIMAWFKVSGFDGGEFVILNKLDTPIATGEIDNNGEYLFSKILEEGHYSISVISYDNITGIHGFIHKSDNFLPDVTVYIYNSTWSDTTLSDVGGYYAFTNLSNTTYTINFKKDRYEDVFFQYTTPTNLSMYRKDIFMIKSTGEYYSRHYCSFTLKNIFGARYSNVDTVVYDNGAIEATSVTGTDGAVTFHLFEDIEYRITFINASQGIDESITITPRDNAYTIYTSLLDFSLDDSATVWASVDYHWSKNRINNSHGFINFTYTDTSNSTWEVGYFINRSVNNSHNVPAYYFISSVNGTWVANSSYTVSTIVPADNTTFVVHFGADNPNLPSLSGSGSAVINFVQGVRVNLGWEDTWKYNTTGIVLIIFVGLLFGAANAHIGAVVCVMTGWFLYYIGWLTPPEISFVALSLATVLSILFVMRKGESLKA